MFIVKKLENTKKKIEKCQMAQIPTLVENNHVNIFLLVRVCVCV